MARIGKSERKAMSESTARFYREKTAQAVAAGPLPIGSIVTIASGTVFATQASIIEIVCSKSGFAYKVKYEEGPYAGCIYRVSAGMVK